jgi:hypothetical protein
MKPPTKPCDINHESVRLGPPPPENANPAAFSRRRFLGRSARQVVGALTCADFLGYFLSHGLPAAGATQERRIRDKVAEADNPHYLIYWFMEGGWESYDMFSPVETPNNVIQRMDDPSQERYRVLHWGEPGYQIQTHGNIRYGYLADKGKDLFADMAVLSSMETGDFHSGDRLRAHMGSYDFEASNEREDDERSVMQAFCEVYGQPYVLPHVSWHYWLSDGELNEVQYTGRRGYYSNLGPPHANTVYGGTPANLRQMLARLQASSGDPVNQRIETFLGDVHQHIRADASLDVVKSYDSAWQMFLRMGRAGRSLDPNRIERLFTDPVLRAKFGVSPQDELISYNSINGNKARSKFSPKANVQALMTYEMLREGMGCGYWIETRDIRKFDSHFNRSSLWDGPKRTPHGQPDQTKMMAEDLWDPLHALVDSLKNTQYKNSGTSLFDHSNIVITSEFGRTIHGDVDAIKAMKITEAEKQTMIDGQDISQHWKVTSAAFLGGSVKGNTQYGLVGQKNLLPIPLMPDGSLDTAYNLATGELKTGVQKSALSSVPDHGDVYATALYLSGINPQGRGRNSRGPLRYIKRA